MPSENELSDHISEKVSNYLEKTPLAGFVLVMSFFTGHMWLYVLSITERPKKQLESVVGRTAAGLWFTVVMAPFYVVTYGEYTFREEKVLQIAVPSVVLAMILQAIVIAILLWRRKSNESDSH